MTRRHPCSSTWCESNHRRGCSASLRVFNDLRLLALHDSHAGVGGAQVDADDGPSDFAVASEPQARRVAEQTVLSGD